MIQFMLLLLLLLFGDVLRIIYYPQRPQLLQPSATHNTSSYVCNAAGTILQLHEPRIHRRLNV